MRALRALTFYNVMRVICLNYESTLCRDIRFSGSILVRSPIYCLHIQDVYATSAEGTEISGNVCLTRDAHPRYFEFERRSFAERRHEIYFSLLLFIPLLLFSYYNTYTEI